MTAHTVPKVHESYTVVGSFVFGEGAPISTNHGRAPKHKYSRSGAGGCLAGWAPSTQSNAIQLYSCVPGLRFKVSSATNFGIHILRHENPGFNPTIITVRAVESRPECWWLWWGISSAAASHVSDGKSISTQCYRAKTVNKNAPQQKRAFGKWSRVCANRPSPVKGECVRELRLNIPTTVKNCCSGGGLVVGK